MSEEWREVVGYEGWYSVSNMGRVRRDRGGKGARANTQLKTHPNPHGYPSVMFCRDGESRRLAVHRLVAQAFLPIDQDRPCVNHKNGIRDDNRVQNLEWCTQRENIQHASRNGRISSGDQHYTRARPELVPRGEKRGHAKLNAEKVVAIRNDTRPQTQIAMEYGVSQAHVCAIRRRRIWKHVGSAVQP